MFFKENDSGTNTDIIIDPKKKLIQTIKVIFILILFTIFITIFMFYKKNKRLEINNKLILIFVLMIPTFLLVMIENFFALYFQDDFYNFIDQKLKIKNTRINDIINNTSSLTISFVFYVFIKNFIEDHIYYKFKNNKKIINIFENKVIFNMLSCIISGFVFVLFYIYFHS